MSTAIEQEMSDTTLRGCIEDNVVVVNSLMFFCNSFTDEQRFSIVADKSEIALCMFSHFIESEKSFVCSPYRKCGV